MTVVRTIVNSADLHEELCDKLPDCDVVLHYPGYAVVDRELTEADSIEATRLYNEEWTITIKPRKA